MHHHLIRERTRTRAGLIVEAGDARECHHIALLVGYGAAAVNPYLALETVQDMVRRGVLEGVTARKAAENLIKALGKGLLKIMSKMGVSTVASYTGAQIFEADRAGRRGDQHLLRRYHVPAGRRRVRRAGRGGRGPVRAGRARPAAAPAHRRLETGGDYQWRREGEPHLFNPETVFKLQHATRTRRYEIFKEYTRLVDDQSARLMTLRGLFRIRGVEPPAAGETTDPRGLGAASHPARVPLAAAPAGRASIAAARLGARPSRWRTSSRCRPSCAGSPPAPCPTGRSRPRHTRPWPSP